MPLVFNTKRKGGHKIGDLHVSPEQLQSMLALILSVLGSLL